jgi:hypothetical protein
MAGYAGYVPIAFPSPGSAAVTVKGSIAGFETGTQVRVIAPPSTAWDPSTDGAYSVAVPQGASFDLVAMEMKLPESSSASNRGYEYVAGRFAALPMDSTDVGETVDLDLDGDAIDPVTFEQSAPQPDGAYFEAATPDFGVFATDTALRIPYDVPTWADVAGGVATWRGALAELEDVRDPWAIYGWYQWSRGAIAAESTVAVQGWPDVAAAPDGFLTPPKTNAGDSWSVRDAISWTASDADLADPTVDWRLYLWSADGTAEFVEIFPPGASSGDVPDLPGGYSYADLLGKTGGQGWLAACAWDAKLGDCGRLAIDGSFSVTAK